MRSFVFKSITIPLAFKAIRCSRRAFNTLAFGEIKPHIGSLTDGRLDLVYYQNPGLSIGDPFSLWTLH
jgi:hypothetical protein